ncbi:Rv3235 family protein [Pseudonocardia sp. WMMC193]|uniref:Rv3235 family protein n=1 Tax=Pseudonocardia sp. WMMC193 TaxID=2911965 RepID=UPI001F3D0920|nr:Rv3235 family protein [Pseudonocardia sp. WMMC193]MCF7550543.1 Rv3235 family protein [Pseudonocardia sp. WMMC193]
MTLAATAVSITPLAPPRFTVVSTEPEADPENDSEIDAGIDARAVPLPVGAAQQAPHLRSRNPSPRTRGGAHLPLVPGSVRAGAREAAARRRAETVVRIALEVFDGHRPLAHLVPYASPEVLRYVAAGVPRRGHGPPHGVLRSLHCRPVERTGAEVTAVCRFGDRARALAARLDLTPTGDWRCTALRVL